MILNLSQPRSVCHTNMLQEVHHHSCAQENDYRPVTLTFVVMRCFGRLVKDYIWSSLTSTLGPLQFAYRLNRSTEDTIAHILQTNLSHLEKKGSSARFLFIDYSLAFKP